jgi:hypothetical protein
MEGKDDKESVKMERSSKKSCRILNATHQYCSCSKRVKEHASHATACFFSAVLEGARKKTLALFVAMRRGDASHQEKLPG